MPNIKIDVAKLRQMIREMIQGKRRWKNGAQLATQFGVKRAAIYKWLNDPKFMSAADVKAYKQAKPEKKSRTTGRPPGISRKSRRILALVREMLDQGDYPSPALIAYRRRMTAHDVSIVCMRHLSDEEKLLMASLQKAGRKKKISKKKKKE